MTSNRLPILAVEIRRAHADVQEAAKTAAERAIAAGHALIEAKALCSHGKWLPWLRDNCALSERTAQLYMRVARSGATSAIVADLGLQAAAKAIILRMPDPFAESPETELVEWSLFTLFLMKRCGWHGDNATHHCEWLKRTGWDSPSQWFGEEGDRYRTFQKMPILRVKTKKSWHTFLTANIDRSHDDINAESLRIYATQPDHANCTPKLKRRAG